MEYTSFILSSLNVLVAFIGILFVALGIFEYKTLSRLRRDFKRFKSEWRTELYNTQKAQQRVVASYSAATADRKISLSLSAINEDKKTFNVYNALGYAYIEKGDTDSALNAFTNAIRIHPERKEGYFDIARLYLSMNKTELCEEYLRLAISVDKTSTEDIKCDPLLSKLTTKF